MSTIDRFLSCDWGTTSFRLRLASLSTGQVLEELKEQAGVKTINDALPAGLAAGELAITRATAFKEFLRSKINQMAGISDPLPIVISGMASSTVGWRDVPYARTPFSLDCADLRSEKLALSHNNQEFPVHLLSGLRAETDMMRGEETEILGLYSSGGFPQVFSSGTILLPGTHSKHVQLRDGTIKGFQTHMTGELFDVLSKHSLLKASIAEDDSGTPETDPHLQKAFLDGVEQTQQKGLSGSLFQVRARAVLQGIDPAENCWFLSGLLIGTEVADLASGPSAGPTLIAAPATIAALYELAIGASSEVTRVPADLIDRAAVLGHAAWLKRQVLE